MSYSDEIIEKVKAKNPNEPEFIQAVTEVMNSLRLVVDNDPKYQNEHYLRESLNQNVLLCSVYHGLTTKAKFRSTEVSVYSSTVPSDLTRAVSVSIHPLT